MKFTLLLLASMLSFLSFAQLTERELQEVRVRDSLRNNAEKVQALRRSAILELQGEDVGQLMQKFAGVAVRSYGGLGGLKTISVRSLGSNHSSIVVDGFTLVNNQTGQINLGQLQTESLESLQLITGGQKNYLVPSSAHVSGSSLLIETFEASFSEHKHQVRFSSKIGSFGQIDNYLSYKLGKERLYFSVFGKYRIANGTYPYSFRNGTSTYSGERLNNFYQDAMGGANLGFKTKKGGVVQLAYRKELVDQELPGAVILYSQNGFQTLKTNNDRIQLSYLKHLKRWSLRAFSAYSALSMVYTDSSYLNSAGFLQSDYSNSIGQVGLNARFRLKERLYLFGGIEEQLSMLVSTVDGIDEAKRAHSFGILGFSYYNSIFTLTGQFSGQYIVEENANQKRTPLYKMNPFFQLESKEIGKKVKGQLTLFYRNSFRMPSFSELYYNSIGNANLRPEKADQISLGKTLTIRNSKTQFVNRASVYYNQVRDKIVAIPTKNLFVWSMQNVGKVAIVGFEESAEWCQTLSKNWSTCLVLNYTFQRVSDITDRHAPTFQHQIAYIPKHSGNADLTVKRKNTGLRISNFASSLRYSLNENIPANKVDGFWLTDLAVFTKLPLRNHDIRLQFTLKNTFNSSYAIVRYYVMPGRSFLISLNYAFK
ncbi:MAG: TonB-dependent receptor [Crocinitomicaceae bacterium]|nr:MAG: TonB-dependent receptor [Crocinitomicaceae bacterium]